MCASASVPSLCEEPDLFKSNLRGLSHSDATTDGRVTSEVFLACSFSGRRLENERKHEDNTRLEKMEKQNGEV